MGDWRSRLVPLLASALAAGCVGGAEDAGGGSAADADSDADGAGDADSDADGAGDADSDADGDTDADTDGDGVPDDDGDGFPDDEEIACGADPLDAGSTCFACGWRDGDPGDLGPVGRSIGDTIENYVMIDQCGDQPPLWTFAGEYHILFIAPGW